MSCNVTCGFYCGKRVMAFSMELQVRPTKVVARKLLDILEENFSKLKKLCVGVLLTQSIKDTNKAIELSLHGLTFRLTVEFTGDNVEFIPFSECFCFSSKCLIECHL